MSEYQYYEFAAIDRPLTAREKEELRDISTRARITSSSFVNEYQWGNFKGSPEEFLERYFDVFLYFANWGTHRFDISLPIDAVDPELVEQYCGGDSAWSKIKKDKIILGWESDDEEGGGWIEPEEEASMGALAPLRDELLRGDYRALYLGWLLMVESGEVNDDETEPPVPPGLKKLSAAQTALAEFLRIDSDLLEAAESASAAFEPVAEDVRGMVASLSPSDRDDLLERFLRGDEPHLAAAVRRKLARRAPAAALTTGRTAGKLRALAESAGDFRKQEEERHEAKDRAVRAERAARQREQRLEALAAKGEVLWKNVDELVARGNSAAYDEAIQLLIDLRDLAKRDSALEAFGRRVQLIVGEHTRKSSFVERVRRKNLI